VNIPTYNRASWLSGCVESVRRGGVPGAEIIVVDDGSTDDTQAVVGRLGPNVRYVYQPNGGDASARNRGFRRSRGRYVTFLDSDDRWLPGGHRALIELLERHPELDVGLADALIGNARDGYRGLGAQAGHGGFSRQTSHELPGGFRVLERQGFFCRLVRQMGVSGCAFVYRRTALEAVGEFDETLRYASDWELWLRLAARCTVAYLDRPIVTYEIHGGNLSRSGDREIVAESLVRALRGILSRDVPLTERQHACARGNLARRLGSWGYVAFDRGEYRAARERFAESMRYDGVRPSVLFYWGCCWLEPGLVARLRSLKQRVSRRRSPADAG
jgi:glycosyltransferase involved in cell wall biosynthesis